MGRHVSLPHILFAADEPGTIESVQSYFERAGWKFDHVPDINAAVISLLKGGYDVVITDSRFQKGTCLDLLKAVREKNREQAVIVLSGTRKVAEMVELLREGASDVVRKPVNVSVLEESVRRVMSAVSQKALGHGLYSRVVSEATTFEFNTAELSETRFPLLIIDRLYRAGRISLQSKLRIDLAFQEALTNSIDHGNLELDSSWKEVCSADGVDKYSVVKRERLKDPAYGGKKVKIAISFADSRLSVVIEDSGKGFLPENHSSQPPVDTLSSGRGLTLIRGIMDEVVYEKSGTCLRMTKLLDEK